MSRATRAKRDAKSRRTHKSNEKRYFYSKTVQDFIIKTKGAFGYQGAR